MTRKEVTEEKRLTEVTVSSLPVVGGGTALGLAMRGGGGGGGGASGWGVLVGPVGDGARSYPRQGQVTSSAGITALLWCPTGKRQEGVREIGEFKRLNVRRNVDFSLINVKRFSFEIWQWESGTDTFRDVTNAHSIKSCQAWYVGADSKSCLFIYHTTCAIFSPSNIYISSSELNPDLQTKNLKWM